VASFVLTKRAVTDLEAIWEYTCEVWSDSQAEKYYQLLIAEFKEICEVPEKGKAYDDIEAGLKGWRVGKHIVFYLIMRERIKIIRVLHEQMDLKQNLNG